MSEIKRATGLLVIEAVNSNPTGDPDRESEPRQRPNGRGEISPVSFKRKLRDLVEDADSPFFQSLPEKFSSSSERYRILESRGRDRATILKEMAKDTTNFNDDEFLTGVFVKKYWDARVFGNTFLESKENVSQNDDDGNNSSSKKITGKKKSMDKRFIKTGVVQFGVGVSISPIEIVRHTNTNKAGVQDGKNAGMAPLAFRIVQHGVYVMPFFVNPNYAHKSGCTADDIELMKLLIPQAYDLNRSSIRPDVRIRHAWYIEHKNTLGSCPDYLLFEALTPTRVGNANEPSTLWADYEDKTSLPSELSQRVESAVDLMAL
jgi:CRISPR/Cas system type I-B associated protein Csh2 (Cas7 group RAMP superfamily)